MLICPFYNQTCILKPQATLPDFKLTHDCQGKLDRCSFFIKEKIKQIKTESNLKIIIKQVSNAYLVKADGLIYPSNTLLKVDDGLLARMTNNQIQLRCNKLYDEGIKLGYSYFFPVEDAWKLKQKYFFSAIIAVESRLVNEYDIASAMKKALLLADQMQLESLVIIPCDNGTHDIALTSQAQLAAIFSFSEKHQYKFLKTIYICMEDEESEQVFIEYYNRIFGGDLEPNA